MPRINIGVSLKRRHCLLRDIPKHSQSQVSCLLLAKSKWTLLIIRDMLLGKCNYNDFCRSPEKIATNILADRLQKLVANGIAEKWTPEAGNGREAYRLTAKGKSLRSVLEAVAKWGLSNIEGTEARLKPK